jgi:dCMP deaminase
MHDNPVSTPREKIKKIKRPSWDEYFMKAALLVSERSTCLRRSVGAVLVRDKQILAIGYNGAPRNITHCDVTGCLRQELGIPSGERHEICRGLHAEQNVILQAAQFSASTRDSVLYITNTPCSICAKMIINAGIKEVVVLGDYPDKMALDFLKEAGVPLRVLSGTDLKIP